MFTEIATLERSLASRTLLVWVLVVALVGTNALGIFVCGLLRQAVVERTKQIRRLKRDARKERAMEFLYAIAFFAILAEPSPACAHTYTEKQNTPALCLAAGGAVNPSCKGSTMVRVRDSHGTVKAGAEFNHWTVIGPTFSVGNGHWHALCQCRCGKLQVVDAVHLMTEHSSKCRSCSNAIIFRSHGSTVGRKPDRLYRIWSSMKTRCSNPKFRQFQDYGGRGIRVCKEWDGSFAVFQSWALANGYAAHLTLDRYPNGDGNYEPDNCRWATRSEQARHTRQNPVLTAFGETKKRLDWIVDSRCKVNVRTLRARLYFGWEVEEAIATPPGQRGKSTKTVDV